MKTLLISLVAAIVWAGSAGAQTFFHGFAASKNAPLTFNINAVVGNQYPKFPVTVTPVGDPSLGTLKVTGADATFKPGAAFGGLASFNFSFTNPEPGDTPPTVTYTGVLTFADFALVKGNYLLVNDQNGLAFSPSFPSTGMLSVTGSGAATLRDGTIAKAGQFDKNGVFSATIGSYPDGLAFTIQLTNGVGSISGGYNFGGTMSPFPIDTTATKIIPAGVNAGRYSLLMQPGPAGGGTGWATMNVTAAGQISLTGQLDDGTAFSSNSAVTAGNVFPLELNYSRVGSATFRETPEVSDFDGSLSTLAYAPPSLNVIGSRFVRAPATGHLLKYSKPTGTAVLTFTGGDLTDAVSGTATIGPGDAVKALKAPLKQLTIWDYDSPVFGAVGGIFSGQFLNPVAKKIRYFKGVAFQKQNIAVGVFRGAVYSNTSGNFRGVDTYGTVTLTPQ